MDKIASSTTSKMSTPGDAEIIAALAALRLDHPDLGRAKVLQQLIESNNNWVLGEKRLKTFMDKSNPNTCSNEQRECQEPSEKAREEDDNPPPKDTNPQLPKYPLDAQLSYNLNRRPRKWLFMIYGSGAWNFGISPNPDMSVLINDAQRRIYQYVKVFKDRPMPDDRKQYLVHQEYVQLLWEFYKVAGKYVGVSKEHCARQFEAEYRVDPRTAENQNPIFRAHEKRRKAAEYARGKIAKLKEIAKYKPELVPLDDEGVPVYDVQKHGMFVITAYMIDRSGMELGRVTPVVDTGEKKGKGKRVGKKGKKVKKGGKEGSAGKGGKMAGGAEGGAIEEDGVAEDGAAETDGIAEMEIDMEF